MLDKGYHFDLGQMLLSELNIVFLAGFVVQVSMNVLGECLRAQLDVH